jgi:hypothetical protein
MEKIKRNLERALAAIQLAGNEMDRLAILKKSPTIDDETKGIIAAIAAETGNILDKSAA